MESIMKDVKIKTDYITLGQLIKLLSLVGSGGEVKFFLQSKDIKVNNLLENRRGKKLYPNDVISFDNHSYRIVSK